MHFLLTKFFRIIWLTSSLILISSCDFVTYFKDDASSFGVAKLQNVASKTQTFGKSLGRKAGSVDEVALAEVHSVTTNIAPAPIRWDPDLYPRLLLLQYREEGATVARNIASVEGYRLLLGGAAADFSTSVRNDFDATALLANLKVGDAICQGLISPNSQEHGDWKTILPNLPSDWDANLRFLAQRLSGRPSSDILQSKIDGLKTLLDAYTPDQNYSLESYVPVCTALNIDPEWVWL